ncbi:hypothetical protein AU255_17930 [Methyloprofundus sedimenti]|uniref:Plastocyanin-like domain-containing protein n=2 Tax=Methyloprofundus sedimenti TaxID=1420851 RepID=A0A1V8M1B2_9GAMM|nr:hypothetical protein AU255_17930 [Methyloprofundus sedimenti]
MCFWVSCVEAKQHKFEMTIDEVTIQVAPKLKYKVFAFNGQVPAPLIHVTQGDDVEVLVTNNTSTPHIIHWHGVYQTNNWKNDGVPGVTQKSIEAGDSFTYQWKAEKTGSLWYHCHTNVNANINNPVAFHPIAGIWDKVYINGNPRNTLYGIQTYNIPVATADTFDLVSPADHPTNNAIVDHAMSAAMRGAITVLMNMPDADPKLGKGENILIR